MITVRVKDIKGKPGQSSISIRDESHVIDSFTLPSCIATNIVEGSDVSRDCMGWYEQRINAAIKDNDFEFVRVK